MRVPVAWLREYCSPELSTAEIAERFDLTGTEVARIERVGVGDVDGFVVGRVLEAEPHPDADRLTVCKVDVGAGEPEQIVCGAPNVAAGQIVAVARPGAVMPDGTKLGKAKLRGVESSGMILAEDEVGISDEHSETMVLDGDLEPGEPLAPHLPIADDVIELEITPNRPDCLAVYGVARELHAATGAALAPDPTDEDVEQSVNGQRSTVSAEDHVSIEIAHPEICLRFTGRVFEDVKVGPSPLWLKQRLTAAGQRPISNVVDITNYVMLLTGQPVHAFDLDEVRGDRIIVRRAEPGEKMTTLDGVERELDTDMAMVCDAEGPSGIGGIMGGQISEVSGKTTRVLMEMATWVGPNILETSKRLGLRSEASARFEKQLHPDQAIAAQRLAARLMVELCGARMVPGTIDVYPNPVEDRVVCLRNARLEKLLGEQISIADSRAILLRLGFDVPGEDGCMPVGIPGFRDVRRAARGRPDRGGRAHLRARQASHDPPCARARGRPLDAAAAAAAADGGRAPRPWSVRGGRVELHRSGDDREAAAGRHAAAAAREPAQRGPVRDEAASPARRARRGGAERGLRPVGGFVLRVRTGLSDGRPARLAAATARPAARCRWPSGTTSPRTFPATSSRRRAFSRGCSGRSACRSRSSRASGRSFTPAARRA